MPPQWCSVTFIQLQQTAYKLARQDIAYSTTVLTKTAWTDFLTASYREGWPDDMSPCMVHAMALYERTAGTADLVDKLADASVLPGAERA